jgi:hypothetical protein
MKGIDYSLVCKRCHYKWKPRKRKPRCCPKCWYKEYEKVTAFDKMRDTLQEVKAPKPKKKKYSRSVTYFAVIKKK